ncbi:ribonucleoside-triphosphate reductase, adenosylcobalamin-dependent [Streptomyces puniciscabiei]
MEQLTHTIPWGPAGEAIFQRTYSRELPGGRHESWDETVTRVVDGNLSLVSVDHQISGEREYLIRAIESFMLLPSGRHLWSAGTATPFFFTHIAPWGSAQEPWYHFSYVFRTLLEGGGIGSNYSSSYLCDFDKPTQFVSLRFIIHPGHPDASGLIADSRASVGSGEGHGNFVVEDSREGWVEALEAVFKGAFGQTHQSVITYDLSQVRPSGSQLVRFGGRSAGPGPLLDALQETASILNAIRKDGRSLNSFDAMSLDHALSKCVISGGLRRPARMSLMHWQDPEIERFLTIKSDFMEHWTTNISVVVDDAFTVAIRDPRDPLHGSASKLLQRVSDGMLKNGEPGLLNIGYAQNDEPEKVDGCNPCGEIIGPMGTATPIGSVNLTAFALDDQNKLDNLIFAHRMMTRFLIRATEVTFKDPIQESIRVRQRRIGVGHLGVQGYLALLGVKYSNAPDNEDFRSLLRALYSAVKEEAHSYSKQLGIRSPVKVTMVAPNGTTAKLAGATEGISPIYARYYVQRIRFSRRDPKKRRMVEEFRDRGYLIEKGLYAAETDVVVFPQRSPLIDSLAKAGIPEEVLQSADELSVAEFLRFQIMYQELFADNAVSFTVSIQPGVHTAQTLAHELSAYITDIKGTTVIVDDARPQSPYERISQERYEELCREVESRCSESTATRRKSNEIPGFA